MRLHLPLITPLYLCPALWASSLASPHVSPQILIVFLLGSVLIRGAGCTINDLVDHDIDRHVRRTKERPIAAGLISKRQALVFAICQFLLALGLLLTLNKTTILLGSLIVVPIFIYPFLKRFTYWPQIFLGMIVNWGCLMGWTSVTNTLALPALVLYVACLFWTIGYDTVYAFQDYEDDQRLGLKSSALKVGLQKGVFFVRLCYVLFFSGLLGVALFLKNPIFGFSLIPLIPLIFLKLKYLSLKDPSSCGDFFRWNGKMGFLIWAGILLANFVR
ncbi:MAG: hypothetical protein A2977_02605 [Alphaproteobacteria bacterium RIFCSPLOWO2_01_FULL_45_8]|nr:MAG: hypothetical protein A3K20_02770 [Alphaproteobacteria bacterium GWA1_45_9]OFW90109.1 MAG: hypothetical protein A2621_01530 [Alphaproteobacteria bacterium RIFCSPHIGHO2_01_FULL_41_14]OFW96070.1 MAG: hypothetical protein A2977_02605 [Alphaproteobacteria bacterium RIFCSPLOWO2_01_FULL_45_8]OFZ41500.1 MAG: hypothetical protein A2070_09755 [Bdellovibrionales bacterium GWC1_52_8]